MGRPSLDPEGVVGDDRPRLENLPRGLQHRRQGRQHPEAHQVLEGGEAAAGNLGNHRTGEHLASALAARSSLAVVSMVETH